VSQSSARWQITPDASHDQAYAILAQDRVWNCFALADLEPPLRTYSQFALASHEESHEQALCLVVRHPIIGQVLSPFGSPEGVAAILAHITSPECPLIQAQEVHMPVLERSYQPETTWRKQLRMAVTRVAVRPLPFAPPRPVKRLALADAPALTALYQQNSESTFSADLFSQALYFGVYDGEAMVAAGGTHVLVPVQQIAVLGNIFTAPCARGQGYATAITAALVSTLMDEDISLVVLNVFADNGAAIRIYQRLGFATHHELLTGRAILVP
jgi:ribosomal protein S18 acetylase RimI-like enzyme